MLNSVKDLKILVSGASGFIGKNLVNTLLQLEAEVIAIVQSDEDIIPQKALKVIFDGTYTSLTNSLEGKKIDVVVHLATLFLPDHKENQITELINSNILFGTYLLEYSKQTQIPFFINATTYAVSIDHISYNPQNLYAATKKAFTDIMKYYEETSVTKFLTLELTDTYGFGDSRPKFINLALKAIRNNLLFNMSKGEQEICYLFVEDAVNAFITGINMMIQQKLDSGSTYSVFAKEVYTLSNLVDYLQSLMKTNITVNKGFYPYRKREIMAFKPGFKSLPEWEPKFTIADGVNRIIENESH